MPIYEYECSQCGCFEHSQSIHDPPLARCPKCRRKVQRLISATSFQLKGGGWYSEGYQKKSANGSKTEPDAAKSADDSKAATAKGSEAKSAESKTDTPAPSAAESKTKRPRSKPKASSTAGE